MKNLEKINLKPRPIFLKDHTTFKIGGFCRTFYEPVTWEELVPLWKWIQKEQIPYFILGAGSNVLASDGEIEKIIISLTKWNSIRVEDTLLTAGAGALTNDISKKAQEDNLSGLEFIYGLPATLGGALYMNARCFGGEISLDLKEVKLLNEKGELEIYTKDSTDFNYKVSPFQKRNCLIVEASFELETGNSKSIFETMSSNWQKREQKGHFKAPSAGSYFKNDYHLGIPSGVLIEEVGMKGHREGGAQVAPWHANFLINAQGATAQDVLILAQKIKDKVLTEKGIKLEEEVLFLS